MFSLKGSTMSNLGAFELSGRLSEKSVQVEICGVLVLLPLSGRRFVDY